MIPRVLLHGFSGSPRSWDRVAAAPAGGEVVALPLLGHAPELVDGPEASFENEVDRIAAQVSALAGPVDLVGYSLGARTALGLLVRHPELVRRALLVGANPGLESEDARGERAEVDARWARVLAREGIEAFVARWEAIPLFDSQQRLPQDVLAAQRGERLAHDAQGLARSLRVTGLAAMPSYWDELPRLRAPVIWAAGALDPKFRAIAERAAAATALGTAVVVPDAGHNVVLEQAGRVTALIEEAFR